MSNVRVRFAPSPTGFFHIGSARTALFNWLYARKTGGQFVLRIEDTDKERNTDEALQVLLEGMRWLGLDWDEGPEVGGDYGPYFQSQRNEIYDKHLEILRDKGLAYDKEGAVFFKISEEPQIIEDQVRGRVERTEEKDFVIYRSDGSPVFHFVNVVDDLTMGITHVIRGEDHLSNTSKHMELFKGLGAEPPVFAHIPLILKQEGQGKMSKRDKGALIGEYQERKFLPNAVVNYLSLLGWNPKDDQEVMSVDSIIEQFDFKGIQKGGARFDEKKMAFVNTEHLRALVPQAFQGLAREVLADLDIKEGDYFAEVMQLAQPKASSLETLNSYVDYFFKDDFVRQQSVLEKISKKGDPKEKIEQVLAAINSVEGWTVVEIENALLRLARQHGQEKPFAWFPTIRWSVSGLAGGPDMIPMLQVMGRERVIRHLEKAKKLLN